MSEMTGDLSYDVLVCGAGRSEVGDFSYDPFEPHAVSRSGVVADGSVSDGCRRGRPFG